ncbi:MAG: class I SAM-dependent methyltransferase [Deltaproteobacteria bacterium]
MKSRRSWKQSSTWQILFGETIVPRCVPLTYRVYLLAKKLQRSLSKRRSGRAGTAAGTGEQEGEVFMKASRLGPQTHPFINKTVSFLDADLGRPEVAAAVRDLQALKAALAQKGLRTTSAAGSFKEKDFVPLKEKNKLWENAWVLAHAAPQAGESVLDIGGASTLFSFCLAQKGARVSVVDNDWGLHGLIYNARHVARRMGWPMKVLNRDLNEPLPFKDAAFDKAYCVCVLEHLPPQVRRSTMAEIGRVLKPKGLCALTVDFDAGRRDAGCDKGLRFGFPQQLRRDVLDPSGLTLMGNQTLTDDCPESFFLGAVFLKKE